MSQHKVRTHKWYNGILQFRDFVFGSREEAVIFAQSADADTAKIYDHTDQIVHEINPVQTATYA
jgi:sugar/nucleoside kinase (ribokinase family)